MVGQGIDGRGLAGIGATGEGYLGDGLRRQVAQMGDGDEETCVAEQGMGAIGGLPRRRRMGAVVRRIGKVL